MWHSALPRSLSVARCHSQRACACVRACWSPGQIDAVIVVAFHSDFLDVSLPHSQSLFNWIVGTTALLSQWTRFPCRMCPVGSGVTMGLPHSRKEGPAVVVVPEVVEIVGESEVATAAPVRAMPLQPTCLCGPWSFPQSRDQCDR